MICHCTTKRKVPIRMSVEVAGVRWRIRECKLCGGGFCTAEMLSSTISTDSDIYATIPAQVVSESVGEVVDGGVDLK